jgi:hypothetical protein
MIARTTYPFRQNQVLTFIATYENCDAARKAKALLFPRMSDLETFLDIEPEYIGLWRNGAKVLLRLFFHRYPTEAEQLIKKTAAPKNLSLTSSWQTLSISLLLPKGMSKNFLPLLLDPEELRFLHWLGLCCGKPVTQLLLDGANKCLTWQYRGEGIYNEKRKMIHASSPLRLRQRKHWLVTVNPNPLFPNKVEGPL